MIQIYYYSYYIFRFNRRIFGRSNTLGGGESFFFSLRLTVFSRMSASICRSICPRLPACLSVSLSLSICLCAFYDCLSVSVSLSVYVSLPIFSSIFFLFAFFNFFVSLLTVSYNNLPIPFSSSFCFLSSFHLFRPFDFTLFLTVFNFLIFLLSLALSDTFYSSVIYSSIVYPFLAATFPSFESNTDIKNFCTPF